MIRLQWRIALVMAVPTLLAAVLSWQEFDFRRQLAASANVPPTPLEIAPPLAAPAPIALAALLGLQPLEAVASSLEKLALRGVFLATAGASRVLLADGDQQRFFAVGERLPSGSSIRRIEPQAVVLWRDGREERLALVQPQPLLQPVQAAP